MSDETTARQATPTPPAGKSSSGPFMSVLLGGVIAGGLGYLAAYYTEFGLFEQDQTDVLDQIAASLDEQSARLTEVEGRAEQSDSTELADGLRTEIGSVTDQISELADRLAAIEGEEGEIVLPDIAPLEERIAALESGADDGASNEQVAGLTSRIDELAGQVEEQSATIGQQAQTLEEQRAAIDEAEQIAQRETSRIAAQGSLSEIRVALESGEPYADAIGELESASGQDIPEALSAPAGDGLPTLFALQEDFPQAARTALAASVGETAGDGTLDRLGAFLKSQTGARSLSEQEGDGADAILSRAEARLGEGDIAAAISEIERLPQAGQDALSDWTARARTRADAKSALDDLSQSINSM